MKRLASAALARLPGSVQKPGYDRGAHRVGIVHLGIGAFHRAHQATYTEDVLEARGGDWRIAGVSLRSPGVARQLNPQDGLYAVNVKSAKGSRYRVIGAVDRVLVAPDDPAQVLERMAHPDTRVVTLTVTEKGYCHDPASGRLQADHPAVLADLASPDAPVSAPGFVVAALDRRRARALDPFTVVSCDNLPGNGETLRRIVIEHAALRDEKLAGWIERNVAFPSTMIDRIVPATTAADLDAAAAALGLEDRGLMVTEPFTQWVIEDRFTSARPAWELAGAQLADDVAPFEHAKLRMLNGSHSTLAYLGYLGGYEFVHQAMEDEDYREFVGHLMGEEIAPTLQAPAGLDLAAYRTDLLERFTNPALRHRTWQIAMDGSQKLPQRLLGTIRDRLDAGEPVDGLSLSVAAWIRYVHGIDERGAPIEVEDPLADELAARTTGLRERPAEAVREVFALREVFGSDLAERSGFRNSVTAALELLVAAGARSAVRRTLESIRSGGDR